MFVFRKNWCALFSWNTRFEIRLFAYYRWIIQNSDDHFMEIRQTCLHYHGNFENLRYITWIEVYPSAMKKQSKSRQSLFFNKVVGLRLATFIEKLALAQMACNFIKRETLTQMFSGEFCEISKNALS